jgi:hypothetical protein
LPFRYLTLSQDELADSWSNIDSPETWERFATEFAALPTLEESLAATLQSIDQKETCNGQ